MNTEKYKRQLKAKEQDLLVQLTRAGHRARESTIRPGTPATKASLTSKKTNSSEAATLTGQH